MIGDKYICEIGRVTGNLSKAALGSFLYHTYLGENLELEEDRVGPVLQAIANAELGTQLTSEAARGFAAENRQTVRRYARRLIWEQSTLVYEFLYDQYSKWAGLDRDGRALSLAAAVTNMVFADQPTGHDALAFAEENREFIKLCARKIGSDDGLCAILSGAAFNVCYARYASAGGSRGLFSDVFIAYIRALSGFAGGDGSLVQLRLEFLLKISNSLGEHILAPLESMASLGIFRPLPRNPNERRFFDAVHQFATKTGMVQPQ